jgi:hypothetical protein
VTARHQVFSGLGSAFAKTVGKRPAQPAQCRVIEAGAGGQHDATGIQRRAFAGVGAFDRCGQQAGVVIDLGKGTAGVLGDDLVADRA